MRLMVCVADYFIKSPIHSIPFHAPSFYSAAQSRLAKLCKLYIEFATEVPSFFPKLMSMKLQGQPDYSLVVKQLFFSDKHLFNYEPRARISTDRIM